MPRRMVTIAVGVVMALAVTTGALASAPATAPSGVGAAPTVPAVQALFDRLSTAWWQWALAIPVHSPPGKGPINHPLFDLTGTKCGVGQSGPVWFLGGAFFVTGTSSQSTIVRDGCVVPFGRALFFPLINIEDSALEEQALGNPTDIGTLRGVVNDAADKARHMSARVDRIPVPFLRVSRNKAPWSFTLAPDDLLSAIGEGPFSPGTYSPAVDDGFYVLLPPLPPGRHTVQFHGEVPAFGVVLDVTYHLRVAL
jgi:hypothetical protein